jgi:hypothetical protein
MVYPRELVSDFDVRSYPEIDEPRSLAQLGVRQSWEELKSDPHLLEHALGEDYYAEFPKVTAKRADWTRERLEYALSLDAENLCPNYTLLNLLRTAYLDQTQGKPRFAREIYLRLARLCAGMEDAHQVEETGPLQERVKELERLVEERFQWSQSLERTIADERAQYALLRADFEERTAWALSLEKTVAEERACYERLRAEFEERTAWALALDEELQRLRQPLDPRQENPGVAPQCKPLFQEGVPAQRSERGNLD